MSYDFNSLTKQAAEADNRKKFYTDFEDVDPNVLHQISDLTEWIRTKGKGSDVREVIAQLFERTWLEATKEGNANMEVAQARGGFHELSARLSNFEGIVNAKADEAEIKSMLQNILDGSPKGTFENMASLKSALPGGDKGIYITIDNKNWNYWTGSEWKSGGIYQASGMVLSNSISEGKTVAVLRTNHLSIDFDEMKIVVEGAAIMDGVNNIWPSGYAGNLSRDNGFLVYNKVNRKFDMAPIEFYNSDNIILGFFWANGVGNVNSISYYDVRKNGRWQRFNERKIQNVILIGGTDVTIKDFRFSEKPIVQTDSYGKKVVWDVASDEITRIDNATSGYILFDSNTKTFFLKKIETELLEEPTGTYYLATLWENGFYTESGVLKNPKNDIPNKIANNIRIITLGDSITEGLKNYNTPKELFDKAWPDYMLEHYGGTLTNVAVSGKSIFGTGPEDFNGQVNANNFAGYDLAIIAFGTNDLNAQANLEDVKTNLKKGLNKIYSDNQNINVVGVLPHNLFRLPFTSPANTVYVDALTYKNKNGLTLNNYCNAIAAVYDEYQIPYIDWRKSPVLTMRNYNKWTWDAIHPNESGHALIGRRIAEWLKVNV